MRLSLEGLGKKAPPECPEPIKQAVLKHYIALRDVLVGKGDWRRFADFEKYSDVWARLTSLPADVVFPAECGHLDLPNNLKAQLNLKN